MIQQRARYEWARIVTVMLCALPFIPSDPALVAQSFSGKSSLCGQVEGKTAKDRDNVITFCSKGLVPGTVTAAVAMDSILWLKVSRPMADALRRDRLSGEQVVKQWMSVWRALSGRRSVTVHVEWMNVEVATGDTTVLSGDRVTIR